MNPVQAPTKPPRRILRKSVAWLATISVALFAASDAALAYWRSRGELAVPAFAADPGLKVRQAERRIAVLLGSAQQRNAIHRNALAALEASPLDAVALRQLAVISTIEQRGGAFGQLELVERLSRRDLVNEILHIDNAAGAGRVEEALLHYDHALSVHTDALEQLYPVLASALPDERVRQGLVRYAGREWLARFVGEAIGRGGDPRMVVNLMNLTRSRMPAKTAEQLTVRLLSQLKDSPHYPELNALARGMPGTEPAALDRFAISPATSDIRLAPIAWSIRNDATTAMNFDSQGRLTIAVSGDRVETVATRTTMLKAGAYRLAYRLTFPDASSRVELDFAMTCLPGSPGSPLAIGKMPRRTVGDLVTTDIVIPAGCAAQRWELQATPPGSQFDASVRLDAMQLERR